MRVIMLEHMDTLVQLYRMYVVLSKAWGATTWNILLEKVQQLRGQPVRFYLCTLDHGIAYHATSLASFATTDMRHVAMIDSALRAIHRIVFAGALHAAAYFHDNEELRGNFNARAYIILESTDDGGTRKLVLTYAPFVDVSAAPHVTGSTICRHMSIFVDGGDDGASMSALLRFYDGLTHIVHLESFLLMASRHMRLKAWANVLEDEQDELQENDDHVIVHRHTRFTRDPDSDAVDDMVTHDDNICIRFIAR